MCNNNRTYLYYFEALYLEETLYKYHCNLTETKLKFF